MQRTGSLQIAIDLHLEVIAQPLIFNVVEDSGNTEVATWKGQLGRIEVLDQVIERILQEDRGLEFGFQILRVNVSVCVRLH